MQGCKKAEKEKKRKRARETEKARREEWIGDMAEKGLRVLHQSQRGHLDSVRVLNRNQGGRRRQTLEP